MSAVGAVDSDVRVRTRRLALPASANVGALGALSVLSTLLLALTWRTWGDVGVDTGYDLLAATRLADGELPYADFTYYYGPLGPAVIAAGMLVGGSALTVAAIVGVASAFAIVFLTYALGRALAGVAGGFLAAAITASLAFAPNNFSMVLPHSFSASFGVLAALALLVALERASRIGRSRYVVAAGVAVGCSTLTRPEFAAACILAAALWLAVRRYRHLGRRHELALLIGPALAIPAVVYGAFLTQVSLERLVWENLYPADELRQGGNRLLETYAPLTPSSFAELAVHTGLYAVGAFALVLLGRFLSRRSLNVSLAAAGLLGAAVGLLAVLVRAETTRYYLEYAYAWVPAGALVALAVCILRVRRAKRPSAELQLAIAAGAILVVLAAKVYDAFIFHAPFPQLAVYAAPFAALLLARLHLVELARTRAVATVGVAWLACLAAIGAGLTIKDAASESASVSGPGGTLAELPSDASVFQGALDSIERETKPGDPILLAPQLTTLYVLSGRENPLPQLSLLPGALPSAADEQRAIATLARERVPLIVLDRRVYDEYGHGAFGQTFARRVDGWIRSNYERATVLRLSGTRPRTLEVWRRSS